MEAQPQGEWVEDVVEEGEGVVTPLLSLKQSELVWGLTRVSRKLVNEFLYLKISMSSSTFRIQTFWLVLQQEELVIWKKIVKVLIKNPYRLFVCHVVLMRQKRPKELAMAAFIYGKFKC